GSRTTGSITYQQRANLYQPYWGLGPGFILLGGDGSVNEEGTTSLYNGPATCLNTMQGVGPVYMGFFNTPLSNDVCPAQLAPISRSLAPTLCIRGDGQCNLGSVQGATSRKGVSVIAAGATTAAIYIDEISTSSRIRIWEDMKQGAALGVTCNTTQGRTYAV